MRLAILLASICLSMSSAFAQPGNPNGGNPPGVPITGLEVLIAGGAAYGARKLLKRSKPNPKP